MEQEKRRPADAVEVEICAASKVSLENARAGGAERVEVCRNLEVGGLTPDMETVAYSIALGLRTRVLIRPREGDFVYSEAEYQQILEDIWCCRQLGAEAVVVGFLNPDGTIDEKRTRECVAQARPMEVTFHRAFDESTEKGLEKLIDCGVAKLLTSGQKPTALEGMETLSRLVEESRGRIGVIAASGVRPENVAQIMEVTGVREVHGSCKEPTPEGGMETSTEEVKELMRTVRGVRVYGLGFMV